MTAVLIDRFGAFDLYAMAFAPFLLLDDLSWLYFSLARAPLVLSFKSSASSIASIAWELYLQGKKHLPAMEFGIYQVVLGNVYYSYNTLTDRVDSLSLSGARYSIFGTVYLMINYVLLRKSNSLIQGDELNETSIEIAELVICQLSFRGVM